MRFSSAGEEAASHNAAASDCRTDYPSGAGKDGGRPSERRDAREVLAALALLLLLAPPWGQPSIVVQSGCSPPENAAKYRAINKQTTNCVN
jgi:hypothetical protein